MRLALESLQYSNNGSSDRAFRTADVETTPSSMTKFYEHYMALIASEKPFIASIAEKMLYWLVFAIEPLRASDIICAISLGLTEADERVLQPIDGAKLAQCCQGLIDFDQEADTLRLVHRSAREFLCQKLDSSIAHTYMGKVCLLVITTWEQQADQSALSLTHNMAATGEEGLFAYARRNYLRHVFQAVSTDQRIGPFIDTDDVGFLGPMGRSHKKHKH